MAEIQEKIVPVLLEEEMRNSYIDYSMSVIVARALPDVRDGLKPVHRRVLYGMLELGLRPNSQYKKSARIVGEVLGKYHPHGDTAVYDAMVRMVQEFSMRYPLVDGQGNFGSVDGDSPAAMRYTEARLAPIAEEVLRDIEKNTVAFGANFDDTLKEPTVLPSLLPTLLVNGTSGIAVGMATNIPPHNLTEVVDALTALISNPKLKPVDLRQYLKGPDFPTGAIIQNTEEIDSYFKTGRGKIIVRARAHIEEMHNARKRIVVTEIPYQVNKSALIERAAGMVRDKKLEGITDIRDESDREGMRIVFELRKDEKPEHILNELYKHTQMQTTFGVILLALVDGQPKVLNIKEMLTEFLEFRHEVILKRTTYELDQAEKRAHILEGLKIALDNIDEMISIIRNSRTVDTARLNLIKRFRLSEIQAQAILDMRLQRLTGLERKKIEQEYLQLIKQIEKLKSLLASKSRRMQLVNEELVQIKEKYGDNRRTQIYEKKGKDTFKQITSEEDLVVAISHQGFIQKTSLVEYQEDKNIFDYESAKDFAEYIFKSANSHLILCLSSSGHFYRLRTSYIPQMQGTESRATIHKIISAKINEKFVSFLEITTFNEKNFVLFATRNGLVKKVALSEFARSKDGHGVAMNVKSDDQVVSACLTSGKDTILMATALGKAIRFSEQDVRDMGLSAGGIKGISLDKNDYVIGMIKITEDEKSTILSVTNLGYGKRSLLSEYGQIRRGGKGIVNYKVSDKVGRIAAISQVQDKDQICFITKNARKKRQRAKDIKVMGRATQGIVIANVAKGDEIFKIMTPEIIQ